MYLYSLRSLLKKSFQHKLITGTLILTATGLLSRLIGFFYRIYLSRLFGEENMGIYQLISPIISLSFSLTAAGYQTAVSKLTAELSACNPAPDSPLNKRPFWVALGISLPLSLLCTLTTFLCAEPIGILLLKEPKTIPLIRIIAFSFPFVGIHACINGWFYGMKKAGLPSLTQIIEQLTRVGCVWLITAGDLARGKVPSIGTAVFGLAVGELVSMSVAVLTFLPYFSKRPKAVHARTQFHACRTILGALLVTAVPLTANRLVLTILGSMESVAIPVSLRSYGYSGETALSAYGVLTGMALPLIFFPNALTGSIAVMLLPMISENYCLRNTIALKRLTLRTLKTCLYMGLFFLTLFVLFGPLIGELLFDSPLAGRCIRTLGFICPFLYLDTTLSSILQGLGRSGSIFVFNVCSLLIRLGFVFFAVPHFGLPGYLWGMLASQLILTILSLRCLCTFFRSDH